METNQFSNINANELVFALDIGTRTVIGVVGIYEDNKLKILASEIIEHDKRNMYDGQIHDINGVVKVVKKVKDNLEKRLGVKLEKVAIAAAGRALMTYRLRIDREIDATVEINKRLIESLEMESIQQAQTLLEMNKSKEETKYYCVGYTVVNYYLDDNFIDNLEGHRGNKIGADVLGTFLPHVVVDSLYTVMDKVDLEVINITLEPIAAINVAIKKSLRLLNLALVDIGAGTSDIAITKDGTIVAYAMASVAGDEITEKIAKTYLLDFDTAEKLKIDLNNKDNHVFYDVVGIQHELTTAQIIDSIDEAIRNLAKEISNGILEYNQKSPSAVFLIGGGSQISRLGKYIAQHLELPEERVVIRNTEIIEKVEGIEDQLQGPHAITPIGIAMSAVHNKYKDFLEVVVNDQKVKLFNSKEIKVSDALVLIGYNPRKLIPKRGEEFRYYLNDEEKTIKGQIGEPAKILVNGEITNLEFKLKNGDNVKIIEASEGKRITLMVYDCIDINKYILFNGEEINLINDIKINEKNIEDNIALTQNDRINTEEIKTIGQLLKHKNIENKDIKVYRNGEIAYEEDILNNKDVVILDFLNKGQSVDKIKKFINVTINGKAKKLEFEKKELVFVDVFNYIDFNLSKPRGSLILNLNGKRADYHQKLNNGDEIEIYWK